MMRRALSTLVAAAAAVSTGCATFGAADRSAIEAVLDQQRKAWNAGDVVGFMDGYARRPDIVFTSGGAVRRGFDQTLAKYRKSYADKDAMGRLAFEVLQLQPLGPQAAVMLGRWTLTDTPKAATGLFTLVWQKVDGAWRIVHDHSSVTPPPQDSPP